MGDEYIIDRCSSPPATAAVNLYWSSMRVALYAVHVRHNWIADDAWTDRPAHFSMCTAMTSRLTHSQ